MEGLELVAFQIISAVGSARSMYIEAIEKAKSGDTEEAKNMVKQGQDMFREGHEAHAKLIQMDASGEINQLTLLIMHAEDQLMSAESFAIIAEELIAVYEKMSRLEGR